VDEVDLVVVPRVCSKQLHERLLVLRAEGNLVAAESAEELVLGDEDLVFEGLDLELVDAEDLGETDGVGYGDPSDAVEDEEGPVRRVLDGLHTRQVSKLVAQLLH
jgi:hypothetical protein